MPRALVVHCIVDKIHHLKSVDVAFSKILTTIKLVVEQFKHGGCKSIAVVLVQFILIMWPEKVISV